MVAVRGWIAFVIPSSVLTLLTYLWWKRSKRGIENNSVEANHNYQDDKLPLKPSDERADKRPYEADEVEESFTERRCETISSPLSVASQQLKRKCELENDVASLLDDSIIEVRNESLNVTVSPIDHTPSSQQKRKLHNCIDDEESNVQDIAVRLESLYTEPVKTCHSCKRKISIDNEDVKTGLDDSILSTREESLNLSGNYFPSEETKRKNEDSDDGDSIIEYGQETVSLPAEVQIPKCDSCKRKISEDSGVSEENEHQSSYTELRNESINTDNSFVEDKVEVIENIEVVESVNLECEAINLESMGYGFYDDPDVIVELEEEDELTPLEVDVFSSAKDDFDSVSPPFQSCDADSAYTEDYSSDSVSISGSDGVAKSPPAGDYNLVDGKSSINADKEPHRQWYGPDIAETDEDWSNTPMSDDSKSDKSNLPNILGVSLDKLSLEIPVDSEVKTERSRSTPRSSSPKKVPGTPRTRKGRRRSESSRDRSTKERSRSGSSKDRSSKSAPASPKKAPKSPRPRRVSDEDNWREVNGKKERSKSRQSPPRSSSPDEELLNDKSPLLKRQFTFPDEMCGRLIGKAGKNIADYKQITGAEVIVETDLSGLPDKVVVISGTANQIKKLANMINKRFDDILKPVELIDLSEVALTVRHESLPTNDTMDVLVTAVVDAGNFFVQFYEANREEKVLENLQKVVTSTYFPSSNAYVFPISDPPKENSYAMIFDDGSWHRVKVVETPQDDMAVVSYLDTGGMAAYPTLALRQMTAEILAYPFQGIECYLANVLPHKTEYEYSYEAAALLGQLTSGQILQASVKLMRNGIPCVDLYTLDSMTGQVIYINQQMVDSGLTRWSEV